MKKTFLSGWVNLGSGETYTITEVCLYPKARKQFEVLASGHMADENLKINGLSLDDPRITAISLEIAEARCRLVSSFEDEQQTAALGGLIFAHSA